MYITDPYSFNFQKQPLTNQYHIHLYLKIRKYFIFCSVKGEKSSVLVQEGHRITYTIERQFSILPEMFFFHYLV